MKAGIELAMDEQNAAGGIRGRQLQLKFLDDAYDPLTAEANTRMLVDAQVDMSAPNVCPSSSTPESNGQVPPMSTPISTNAIHRGPNAVLAVIGNIGTPTMVRAAPVALESSTVYFGAFTGATKILRDGPMGIDGPCWKYVFNYRASYAQEAQATVDLFKHYGMTDYTHLISFDQHDTFGDAGYNGLLAAYPNDFSALPTSGNNFCGSGSTIAYCPIPRYQYTRNDDTTVPPQALAAEAYIKTQLTNAVNAGTVPLTIGVMMTDTYGAGADFITLLRQWQYDGGDTTLNKPANLKLYFSNVSFVGPNALSDRLVMAGNFTSGMPMTTDVTVSQVVPNYQSDTSDIVVAYNKAIAAAGDTPGFTSLEGYIATKIFIAGLLDHDGPITPDALIDAFENLPNLSLGIGAAAGFSAMNHQYSSSVWGTSLTNGTFKNLYYWTVGQPISFFE